MVSRSSSKPSRSRLILWSLLIVTIACVLTVGALLVRRAQRTARRLNAYGRLCQMRLALQTYESQQGTLPPLCLRDDAGNPLHGWRALIVPNLDLPSLRRLDLSQPCSSVHNRELIESVPIADWSCFARDLRFSARSRATTHILALLGTNSIWDPTTGLPKGGNRRVPGLDPADFRATEQHRADATA